MKQVKKKTDLSGKKRNRGSRSAGSELRGSIQVIRSAGVSTP